jgi:phosphoglycerate dehydrogenase-like enzyme
VTDGTKNVRAEISTRVAVTSRSFSKNATLRRELLELFPNTTFNDQGLLLTGDILISFLEGHDRAIVALERITDGLVAQLPQLKIVSKYGVGLDNIDIEALRRHGRRLGWQGGVNRRSVAELAICFMIALLHNVPSATQNVRDGGWQQIMGRQLSGKTVGIIGCGHVGKDLVRLLKPFDVATLAYDIVDYRDFYVTHGVEPVALDELLERADAISIHLPQDESTQNILDAAHISRIKTGAVLVNTARGGLVNETAVVEALTSGQLAGAAFDVFAQEPPMGNALLGMPNVLVTPHIGGSAEEAILAMGRAAIRGLTENAIP